MPLDEALVEVIDSMRDPDVRIDWPDPSEMQLAGFALENACRDRLQGNPTTWQYIRQARRIAQRSSENDGTNLLWGTWFRARQLSYFMKLAELVAGGSPEQVDQIRSNLHGCLVNDAFAARQKLKHNNLTESETNEYRGFATQNTFMALLTRYKHPWMAAVPALPHQEQGKRHARNFDTLLVEVQPGTEDALGYKLQAKCRCIGICDKPVESGGTVFPKKPVSSKTTDSYGEDIVLVSGCCDMRVQPAYDRRLLPVTRLLYLEYIDIATTDEILELDRLTDNLLFNVTMHDPRRRGKVPADIPKIELAS